MGADFELTGMGDIIDSLEMMVENYQKVEDEALTAGAVPIFEEARNTTAFIDRSGDLRKSLQIAKAKTDKKGKRYILVGSFKRDAFYARMVEFGTSTADPHPYLAPAFERQWSTAHEIIKQKLKEALKG